MQDGFVRALDGQRLYWTAWGVEEIPAEQPVAVLVHGYGEHIARYEHVAQRLLEGGIAVVGIDVRGHGKSSGDRGHVMRYDEYMIDVAAGFDIAARLRPHGARILIGHSNGGLIALRYALSETGTRPNALVLSGPLLKLAAHVPAWKATLSKGLSKLAPAVSMPSEIDAGLLSHDQGIVQAYKTDPLVHRVATARWFNQMVEAQEDALVRAPKLSIPVLVMHGGSDQIVSPEGSRQLVERLRHDDVQYEEFEGLYHEIFNELGEDREKVLTRMTDWLAEHGFWYAVEDQEAEDTQETPPASQETPSEDAEEPEDESEQDDAPTDEETA